MKAQTGIAHFCVIRVIATHLMGHDHKFWHRGLIGVLFMILGVVIAKESSALTPHLLSVLGDTLGYGLHGIGLIPFVEALLEDV